MYDYPCIITFMDTDTEETTNKKISVKCNITLVLDEHNKVAIRTWCCTQQIRSVINQYQAPVNRLVTINAIPSLRKSPRMSPSAAK